MDDTNLTQPVNKKLIIEKLASVNYGYENCLRIRFFTVFFSLLGQILIAFKVMKLNEIFYRTYLNYEEFIFLDSFL